MEKSIKALREERNAVMAKGKELIEMAEKENRALNKGEAENLKSFQTRAKKLDESIKLMEEQRSLEGSIIETKETETRKKEDSMVEKETREAREKRAIAEYLRDGSDKEIRAIQGDYKDAIKDDGVMGNGGITVPTYISGTLIKKLTESAPVLAAVQKFTSANGNLKIIREDSFENAGFVGEGADVKNLSGRLKSVTLSQKRAGAAIQLTEQLILDSAFDVVSYATDKLTRSLAKTLERAILVGSDGDPEDSFKPIIGSDGVETVDTKGKFDVESMLDIYDSINPEYLTNSMFIVSRPAFNAMTKLQDGNKTYLIFRGIVDGKPGFTFKGIPVYVSDTLNDSETDIIFGDFNAGYGFMERQGLHLINVTQDTTQALAGGHLVMIDGYFDGAVINPDAIKVAKSGQTPAKKA